jgi:hypothetical protein
MKATIHNVASIHHRLCQTDWGIIMDASPMQTLSGRFAFLRNALADPTASALLHDRMDTPACVGVWLACPPNPVEIEEEAAAAVLAWLQECAAVSEDREAVLRYQGGKDNGGKDNGGKDNG